MKTYMTLGILALILVLFTGCQSQTDTLTVGMILPLSGPASLYGDSFKEGVELAQKQLAEEGTIINIVYEDSEANPSKGVAAYHKLIDLDNVDLVVSLFSRVSVPLVSLAEEDNTPLIMSVVSAKDVADKSPFAFRFYPDEKGYADAHLEWVDKNTHPKIALLYVNDEYGTSVAAHLRERFEEKGISLVSDEPFEPANTDFRTQLLKIEQSEADAIFMVSAVPIEITSVLQQREELDISADFFELGGSLLSKKTREQVVSTGVYTNAFPVSLGLTGDTFTKEYEETHGKDTFFPAALGYDTVMLLYKTTNGESMEGQDLAKKLSRLKSFDTLNGAVTVQTNGEINPPLVSARVVDGNLELVE